MPISVLMFLNMFGITNIQKIIGIPLILMGALGLIIVQIVNITSAHIKKEFILHSWILCIVMMWPSAIYLTSIFISYPAPILNSLVGIIAAFLFVEGIYSFYIDHETFK